MFFTVSIFVTMLLHKPGFWALQMFCFWSEKTSKNTQNKQCKKHYKKVSRQWMLSTDKSTDSNFGVVFGCAIN